MKYLFTHSGMRILESLCFTKTVFAFDFDGTLSKIVPKPSEATLSPKICMLMQNLSSHARIAIISGRSKKDLATRIPFKSHYMIGNHGLEGLKKEDSNWDKFQEITLTWKNYLQNNFLDSESDPGLKLENKTFTLAIHYRHSRHKQKARDQILNVVRKLTPPPRIIAGKSVLNLIPRGAPHKGLAILEIIKKENATSAFYIGDDDTDEDVFSLPETRILTVRVGRKHSSAAQYYIKRQSEISRLLMTLSQFYKPI
jgi:trehalose 6-phosphate phosphatase